MGFKAVLTATGLVALLAGCGKDPMKNRPVRKAEVQQPAQLVVQSEKYFTIEYLVSDVPGQVKGFRLNFTPEQRAYLALFAPVHYEVPELKLSFPLPVEDGVSSATTTLKNPESVDGKVLAVYGRDGKLEEFKLQYKR